MPPSPPPSEPSQSIYAFIDASNLWEAQKARGQLLQYDKLAGYLGERFKAAKLKVHYYTSYPADGTRRYSIDGKHRFFTFLKKGLGFAVIKKELKRIRVIDGTAATIIEKGNMDVEITLDAVHHMARYDTAVLFSGDADFLPLVTYLRSHGKRVYVFSSRNNVSQELRTGGDGYTDVLDVDCLWGQPLRRREAA